MNKQKLAAMYYLGQRPGFKFVCNADGCFLYKEVIKFYNEVEEFAVKDLVLYDFYFWSKTEFAIQQRYLFGS